MPQKIKIRLRASGVAFFVILGACVTTPDPPALQPCYCGLVKPDQVRSEVCAVWYKEWQESSSQQVLATKTLDSCTPKDCEKAFDGKKIGCSSYAVWQELPMTPENLKETCYCDYVRVENNPQGEEACAIWKPGDPYLKEYHFLKQCEFSDCNSPPFVHSQSYCRGRFETFY